MNKYTLTVKDAEYQFEEGYALSFPTLDVSFKNLLVIKGRIGSGKSLLLKSISGVHFPSKGGITVKDTTGGRIKSYFLHSQPEFNFITGRVGDELEFAGIDSKDFQHFLDRDITQLSGGELKKVAITMAVKSDFEMILLDEPLDMLDDEESLNVANFIIEQSKYKPIIVATHDNHFDDIADKVIRIDEHEKIKDYNYKDFYVDGFTGFTAKKILNVNSFQISFGDRALDSVSFSANSGEIISIFGKNGTGKSLLSRTLLGVGRLYHEGNVEWFIDKEQRGGCLQFPEQMVYQDTILKEVSDVTGLQKADAVLDMLNWGSRKEQSPFGLSDGEKRVMYMLSFIYSRDVSIFDEPFASLDIITSAYLAKQFLIAKKYGKTVIYTANRQVDTVHADRIITVNKGGSDVKL